MCPYIFLNLISFILPRRGGPFCVRASSWGSLKIEIDEFEKLDRAYMLAITTSAEKSQKVQSATKTDNGIKT